ncbi:MAG: NAD(P)-binding protein [Legionellaceae bacterium]|nr:NAD(P)-binding protein [Legionellaceae bacterium]
MSKNIAIIGAGISGAVLSKQLSQNHCVSVFEKARGSGGRMSSHRYESYSFDKGAQDIQISNEDVYIIIKPALDEKIILPWKPTFMMVKEGKKIWQDIEQNTIFSGSGNLNSLVKWFLEDTKVYYGNEVTQLEKKGQRWYLHTKDEKDYGPFDLVIMSQPTEQIIALAPEFKTIVEDVQYSSCLMLYLGLNHPLSTKLPHVIFSPDTLTRWIIQNHLKPGIKTESSLTLQSKPISYTKDTKSIKKLIETMIGDAEELLESTFEINYQHHHMWRYAKVLSSNPIRSYFDKDKGLGIIGDALGKNTESGIESAILSALDIFNSIIQ